MGVYKNARTGRYYLDEFVDGDRVQLSLKTKDKTKAERKAVEIRAKRSNTASLKERGLAVFAETGAKDPRELVTEFTAELERLKRCTGYVETTRARLLYLFDGVEKLADMTSDKIRHALKRVADERELSDRTTNFYRTSLYSFFGWLVTSDPQRWPTNPVEAVAGLTVTGPLRERRSLSEAEIVQLVVTAPAERSIVYRFAATSGLRRSELAGLMWADLDFESGALTIRAKVAKNKKRTKPKALPAGTLAEMKALRGECTTETPIFAAIPSSQVFYRDLAVAGIESGVDLVKVGKTSWRCRVNEHGAAHGVVDFHSLRVSYCTRLAEEGVTLALAQKLMRHSTPTLTSNMYTKLEIEDERAAVAKIDLPTTGKISGSELPQDAATGTYDDGERSRGGQENARGCLPKPSRVEPSRPIRRGAGAVDRASFETQPAPPRDGHLHGPTGTKSGSEGLEGAATRLERIARELLAVAAGAAHPEVLVSAAQELLAEAKRERDGVRVMRHANERHPGRARSG